jgi:predicted nucleic acid-binding protein
MPALQNPRHERYAQLIVEALNNGQPKPYSATHAYIAAGYIAKDPGKPGSAQAASSRLLYRVINRVRELQHIAAKNAAETVEKMARELNEIQYEARADKAHAAAVSAIATKAKILGIIDKPQQQPIDWNTTTSMRDIGCKLLQSVGFASPDDVSIQAAIEANDVFIARLEAIRDRAQTLTIE